MGPANRPPSPVQSRSSTLANPLDFTDIFCFWKNVCIFDESASEEDHMPWKAERNMIK